MNIYQRMAAITADLPTVAKNLFVGEGRSQYKAVGEADVLAAVKPLEAKHGVYSYPAARRVIDSDLVTTTKTYNGQQTETTKYFMRVETVYRFVNVDEPSEFIEITTYGDGIDAGDKASGKAMTYGDKYALLKAYKIITGDDPDQVASDDGKTKRAPKNNGIEANHWQVLQNECRRTGLSTSDLLSRYGAAKPSDLTMDNFRDAMDRFKKEA